MSYAREEAAAIVAETIAERGYIVLPHFLTGTEAGALRTRLQARDAAGELRPAAVGAARQALPGIRGDRTRWIDPADADAAECAALEALETLRIAINRTTCAGLFALECHYALYPPGARYERHVDRLHDDDARVLSVVLYLNEDWQMRDGGELVLHVDDSALLVTPAAGTLVAFLSAQFEHEVLPAARERYSLTGWFRRREAQPC